MAICFWAVAQTVHSEHVSELTRWLLAENKHLSDFPAYLNSFLQKLNSYGLQIIRCTMGVRTTHPQVEALAYSWSDFEYFHEPPLTPSSNIQFFNFGNAIVFENKVAPGAIAQASFTNSPIPMVVYEQKTYRFKYEGHSGDFEFDILEDLLPFKPTEYLAMPFKYNQTESGFSSFVSLKPGGLSDEEAELIRTGLALFVLKFESFLAHYVTDSLLQLYLGRGAGARVKRGRVQLGDVETIESVVWFSDIRDYTRMMTKYPARQVVEWMNAYFEGIIGMIQKYDGEVLKFIGDGLLAVFPADVAGKGKQMRYKALLCARDANRFLASLNKERSANNLPDLAHGVGLHYGVVEYGNIGASSRLDFTVVGESVNKASRIAGLCGKLNSDILISSELANLMKLKFEEMGEHQLKGIDAPQKLCRLQF